MGDPALLGPIGQIALTVQDVERAVTFYRDALGLKHLFSAPPGLAFFEAGGSTHSSVLYFRVADIHAAAETLAARGVGFEGKPHLIAKLPDHDLWMAFFRDSEGNLLALMAEMKRG